MAQTQTWTDTGIAELILLLREEAGSTGMEYIVALNDSDECVANVASTYSDPAEAATHHGDEGLAEQTIDTVGVSGATIEFDHVFTCTATRNVVGIHVLNNEAGSPDVTFIECCFNALLAMEDTDTLTIDGESTITAV